MPVGSHKRLSGTAVRTAYGDDGRLRIEAVQTADFVLLLLSWHLWLLAVIWLVAFAELVPIKAGWLSGIDEPVAILLACGQLCGSLSRQAGTTCILSPCHYECSSPLTLSLSRSAPNGEWPAWRKSWYLVWVVALSVVAFCCVQAGQSYSQHSKVVSLARQEVLHACFAEMLNSKIYN